MSAIREASLNPGIDLSKVEQLVGLYERLESRRAEQAFDAAMVAAQAEMEPISRDASNPSTRSRYATYAALDRVMRPIYVAHGFSVTFAPEPDAEGVPPEHVRVCARVAHRAGHSRLFRVDMPADGKGARGGDVMSRTHATGSALTYSMRYLLTLAFNVAVLRDDDGNAAGASAARPYGTPYRTPATPPAAPSGTVSQRAMAAAQGRTPSSTSAHQRSVEAGTGGVDDPGQQRPGSGMITPEQLAELQQLIKDSKAHVGRLCKYLRVRSIADLPAARFEEARAALQAKLQAGRR